MTNGTTTKKGLSTGAKVAIGCGAVVVLGVIALMLVLGWGVSKAKDLAEKYEGNPAGAAAEMVVRAHPDLDFISSDPDAGTVTFKNKRTGEEATMSFEDISEGRFSITTDEGEFSIDASDAGEGGGITFTGPDGETRIGASASLEGVPDWAPVYPGATGTQGTYTTQTDDGVSGMVNQTTGDSVQQVVEHYEAWFTDNGWTVSNKTSYSSGDAVFGGVTGELDGRTVNIGATAQGGETSVSINYNGKAE